MNAEDIERRTALMKFENAYLAMLDAGAELRAIILKARAARAKLIDEAKRGTMHPKVLRIMSVVANDFELPITALDSVVRSDRYVVPRHIAMVLSLRLTQLGSVRIGQAFNRGHDTVLFAKKSLLNRMEQDDDLAARFAKLEATAKAALQAA